ncbi:DoxX family protein [Halomonas sp. McH1-25]|uniref:DoxX family protein n=1 Tax=unclassified Halomonas TaxID=2609666 RepID=UPI001EF3E18A|nr:MULTISPECIES: DoxX family protein [unclassified Halomonas]MCG7601200.1 DoxX family protein [Halomonas sp. McH1-25]MCP1341890.1 DoxX family protein [Halomonas sp. FL8]MCP1360155.1 DoxX family protein [Halomonas sp. BBD45]MCP1364453.1 DoxX family protein [Halomonas sp. BBD48]
MLQALHNDAVGKLVLRLSVGVLILLHGVAKLLNPGSLSWIGDQVAGHGLPVFLAYGVLIGEVVAPLMAIVGWQTRIAGLLMAANMVVAIFLAHSGELFMLGRSGGWALELQGMFLFGALALVFLGSGRLAVRPD